RSCSALLSVFLRPSRSAVWLPRLCSGFVPQTRSPSRRLLCSWFPLASWRISFRPTGLRASSPSVPFAKSSFFGSAVAEAFAVNSWQVGGHLGISTDPLVFSEPKRISLLHTPHSIESKCLSVTGIGLPQSSRHVFPRRLPGAPSLLR